MKVYIAGPITGYENHNQPAFRHRQSMLEIAGYECLVPHDISPYSPSKVWSDYMRDCIPALCSCDAISILDGWKESRGASLEVAIAEALDLVVI